MKKLFPLFLFIFIFQAGVAQDRGWALGFSIDGTLNKSEYDLTKDLGDYYLPEGSPVGYTMGYGLQFITVERAWNQRWSFQSGLRLSYIKFQPKVLLPFSYGGKFNSGGRIFTLSYSILDQNSFGLLNIPVGIKFMINPKKKWQLFTGLSLVNTLLLNKTEVYKGDAGYHEFKTLIYSRLKIQAFNMALDWNIGLQYPLSPFWKIFLNPGIRLVEFRTTNERLLGDREFLYKNQWLKLSQIKLSVGTLRFF